MLEALARVDVVSVDVLGRWRNGLRTEHVIPIGHGQIECITDVATHIRQPRLKSTITGAQSLVFEIQPEGNLLILLSGVVELQGVDGVTQLRVSTNPRLWRLVIAWVFCVVAFGILAVGWLVPSEVSRELAVTATLGITVSTSIFLWIDRHELHNARHSVSSIVDSLSEFQQP